MFKQTYTGRCHCKKVHFEFVASNTVEIWHCNCSICEITNYEHLFVEKRFFKLITGSNCLNDYKFGTGAAKHLFCSHCGIKSFYEPRSHPSCYSVNFKCIENPPKIANVVKFDGRNKF